MSAPAVLPDTARIDVKLYAEDPDDVDLEGFITAFHGWIRRGAVSGLPIDVADYRHVHHGPGVMLIGHEADHAIDLGDGRPGLLYQRKRDPEGDVAARVGQALAAAAAAAAEAESDPEAGGIRFRTNEVRVRVLDRLSAPNDDATLGALRAEIERALADAAPGAAVTLERSGEAREPFTVRATIDPAPSLAALSGRPGG